MLPSGQYNFKAHESVWYEKWRDAGLFHADPKSEKPHYSLLMPPPNLTGELHMGHAMQHTIMDIVARFKRMQGYDVLLQPGVDHAGIQFQATLERKLQKERGISRSQLGREKFLQEAWKYKEEVYQSFQKTFSQIGISADWEKEAFTLDEIRTKAVITQFKKFWEEGLIYKGAYIVQWCPRCSSAIEDVEMEYKERREELYFVKYPLKLKAQSPKFKDDVIIIATTRPETIFADVAVAVNPTDKRYAHLVGQKVTVPMTDREVSIIADEAVDKEFGTGALKITPAHDLADYEIGRRHKLPLLATVDKRGRLTEIAGELAGLAVREARGKAKAKLEHLGLLEKVEHYTHSVAVCERCKTVIEPLISEEWFVKTRQMAQRAITVIEGGTIQFYPEQYAEILSAWLANIHDWCISRSLWWGHQFPVWYCTKCNPTRDPYNTKGTVVEIEEPATCPSCHGSTLVRDEQVLDTWFSSGIWPLSTLGWPQYTQEFKIYFPWTFEISAPEIKFLWIARMIMLAEKHEGNIPWKIMFFHGMIRDEKGRKFSKSIGNGIEPSDMIEQWGVDALRMTLASYSIPGRDALVSRKSIDERAKNFRNFNTKIWNAAKFVLTNLELPMKEVSTLNEDKNMLKHLTELAKTVTKHLDSFEIHLAVEAVYHSFWHEFCDQYLESTKQRLKGADEQSKYSTQKTLYVCLKTYLQLLHPFIPYITETIWHHLPGEKEQFIMQSSWPKG